MVRSFVWSSAVLIAVSACFILTTTTITAEPLSIDQAAQPAAATSQVPPEVKDAFGRFQNRDIPGALATLEKAVEAHPELPPADIIMAQFCGTSKQAGAAVRYWLEKSTVDNPGDPEAFVMLGRAALQEKRNAEAELLFAKANQLLADFKGNEKRKESMTVATLSQLSQLAMKRNDWKTARENLEALLKLRPDNAATLEMLANTLFQEEKPDEALEKLRAAAAANKDALTPEATMAVWWEKAGDRKKAGESMVEALTAKPQDFKTRLTAANWALQSKSFDQARQQADIAIKLDPTSIKAKVLAGNIALFQKDYPAAVKYFQEVLAAEPTNFTASNNLALALAEEGGDSNLKLALQYANINSKIYPKQPEPSSTMGWVLFKMGKVAEAERALKHAASAGRSLRPDTAFYFASVYAETNRKEEAKKLLESALKTKGLFSEREAAQALLDKLNR